MEKKRHLILDHPILLAVLLPIIGILVAALLPGPIILTLRAHGVTDKNLIGIVNQVSGAIFRLLIAWLFIWLVKRGVGKEFKIGFNRNHVREGMLLASVGLLVAIYNIPEGLMHGESIKNTASGVMMAVLFGIAPGFYEEVGCRGIVLTNLMRKWKGRPNSVYTVLLASSFAFGAVHLINLVSSPTAGVVLQVLYAAALGIFFGAVYLRTRNLWGVAIVHSIIDMTAYLMEDGPRETILADYISSAAIIIVYTVLGFYLVRRKKHEEIETLWKNI